MSCNGCRVLRKGCSNNCSLRPCLQWIDTSDSQSHVTVFLAKFFGRAGLISFISSVPDSQRPAVFQSLLFEACGRTINPVDGAVGLLRTGNWHLCKAAVETVIRGGTLHPLPQFIDIGAAAPQPELIAGRYRSSRTVTTTSSDLILEMGLGSVLSSPAQASLEKQRWPRINNSQETGRMTTAFIGHGHGNGDGQDPRLLNLFN